MMVHIRQNLDLNLPFKLGASWNTIWLVVHRSFWDTWLPSTNWAKHLQLHIFINSMLQARNQNNYEVKQLLLAWLRVEGKRGSDISIRGSSQKETFSQLRIVWSKISWKNLPVFGCFFPITNGCLCGVGWTGCMFVHASLNLSFYYYFAAMLFLLNWIPRDLINIFAAVWYFSVKLIQPGSGSWAGWNNIYSIARVF